MNVTLLNLRLSRGMLLNLSTKAFTLPLQKRCFSSFERKSSVLVVETCRLSIKKSRLVLHCRTIVSNSGEAKESKEVSTRKTGKDKLNEPSKPTVKFSGFEIDRDLFKHIGILTGAQLALNLGFSQIVPVMPLFAAEMGGHLGASGVGLIVSAPSLARVIFNVPLGRLADTIGRKPLMWGGTLLTATGTILTGFSGSMASLLSCRLLVGMGSASSMTGSSAYLADLSDRAPQHRAKIMGINNMLVGSVWIIGPAFGGFLAETYGFRNSFIIAGMGAGLCSLGYTRLPETLRRKAVDSALNDIAPAPLDGKHAFNFKEWWKDVKPLVKDPNHQALIAQSCVQPLRFASFTTVLAIHATNIAHVGPKELGIMFTAMALSQAIGMPIGSYLADKFKGSRKEILFPHAILNTLAYGSMAFATTETHFIAGMALLGFLNSFSNPVIGAFTAEVTEQNKRGQAMSLQRSAGDIVTLVGPISLGLLADFTSCPTSILLTSGLMGTCSSIYLLRAKNSPSFAKFS